MNARQEWRNAVCDSSLDGTAKLVAFVLDRYMDGHGEAWPSKATISGHAACERTTVVRAVHRLERAGFVLVIRSNGRLPNRYRATMPPPSNDGTHATVNDGTHATVKGPTVAPESLNGGTRATRTRSTEPEEHARARGKTEQRPLAGAYRPFEDRPPDIQVDEKMLEFAKGWLQ